MKCYLKLKCELQNFIASALFCQVYFVQIDISLETDYKLYK